MAAGRVQTKAGGNSTGSSNTFGIVWNSNTTTGNAIVIVIGLGGGFTVSSVTDSQSNGYVKATGSVANSQDVEIWYAKNITGGTTPTITVTSSGNAQATGIAREYSGLDTTAPLDKATAASGVGGTASSGATATTTQAVELVVGGWSASSTVPTLGSGYSNLTTDATGATAPAAIEDKDITSTGAQTATFTGGGAIWSCAVATFKEASGVAFIAAKNKLPNQAVRNAGSW